MKQEKPKPKPLSERLAQTLDKPETPGGLALKILIFGAGGVIVFKTLDFLGRRIKNGP